MRCSRAADANLIKGRQAHMYVCVKGTTWWCSKERECSREPAAAITIELCPVAASAVSVAA